MSKQNTNNSSCIPCHIEKWEFGWYYCPVCGKRNEQSGDSVS